MGQRPRSQEDTSVNQKGDSFLKNWWKCSYPIDGSIQDKQKSDPDKILTGLPASIETASSIKLFHKDVQKTFDLFIDDKSF